METWIQSLGYLGTASPRAEAWLEFGPNVLGTPATKDENGTVRLRNDERSWRIAIHPGEIDELRYLGWEVPGPAMLEIEVERLQDLGVDITEGTDEDKDDRGVEHLVVFHDPFGLRHELFSGARAETSFHPARSMSGFVTGPLGLGHVVLAVPSLHRGIGFFSEILGFGLSDTIDAPRSAFLYVNPRHHSLALVELGPVVGLHDVLLEVGAPEDVGTAYDLVRAQGHPLTRELGCHVNDHMFSFYVRSPGGFDVEIGYGGRRVTDDWSVVRYATTSIWGHHLVDPTPPTTLHPTEKGV